jgi:hypothetical protein
MAAQEAVFARLQWQLAELRASLEKVTVAHAAMTGALSTRRDAKDMQA